jgi:DNA modification methylase
MNNPVTIGNAALFNSDCMDVMAQYPDNYFDLAITDPPYGIGIGTSTGGGKPFGNSGSHAIATNNLGFELTACELDKDYFDASVKRITQAMAQESLFKPSPSNTVYEQVDMLYQSEA